MPNIGQINISGELTGEDRFLIYDRDTGAARTVTDDDTPKTIDYWSPTQASDRSSQAREDLGNSSELDDKAATNE